MLHHLNGADCEWGNRVSVNRSAVQNEQVKQVAVNRPTFGYLLGVIGQKILVL